MLDLLAIRRDAGLTSDAGYPANAANPANPANATPGPTDSISQVSRVSQLATPPTDDPLPPGARDLLGWIDLLGPSPVEDVAIALMWPTGAATGLLMRLRGMGLVRNRNGFWSLTDAAEVHALRRVRQ